MTNIVINIIYEMVDNIVLAAEVSVVLINILNIATTID